jgi:hypothetical protein
MADLRLFAVPFDRQLILCPLKIDQKPATSTGNGPHRHALPSVCSGYVGIWSTECGVRCGERGERGGRGEKAWGGEGWQQLSHYNTKELRNWGTHSATQELRHSGTQQHTKELWSHSGTGLQNLGTPQLRNHSLWASSFSRIKCLRGRCE